MDQRRIPEYNLEISADRSSVKDVVKGVLHTIFFHRFFTPLYPATHEILDITLPYVSEDDIETLVETKANSLLRALDASSSSTSPQYKNPNGSQRASITVQFLEKKRRKGWFTTKPDEDIPWETWTIDVTVLGARSEIEASRNRRVMVRSLERAVFKVVEVVNREKGHIPPITTNETNPFPYQIHVNKSGESGWSGKMGIF
ncbi:uncharacterized protein MYCFIDRAFT_211508 [Pseudocercospora fijiensis CIRAD86]|uniref:Autophagy-related protein 101 n=1 Tax=Pseudocercospora fijiensis (strain CIRAD86) TaxID=383855 RepID=M3AXW0_PSEFD|nr:uncharacterized protein MYCFIDRAFT_211508 [Pseudocercospora fijiensis CIRAD86]EME81973.1 hypothetical protein MYCFIDRAFT_211508 [Pseudocercospora fijiensis CIRAD86]